MSEIDDSTKHCCLNDEIAAWCEEKLVMSVVEVSILTTVTYGNRAIGEPLRAGRVEAHATVQGTLLKFVEPEQRLTTDHPSLHGQKCEWLVGEWSSGGLEMYALQATKR